MDETNPQGLLAYFEALSRSTRDEFAQGARLTRQWIDLLKAKDVTEQQFRELFDELERPMESPGSGWFDLWLRVRHWGYELGFAVPDDNPWRTNVTRSTCRNTGTYPVGQLVVGKTYAILEHNGDAKLLRLVNEQGRTRWYPAELFDVPQRPERKWVRRTHPT